MRYTCPKCHIKTDKSGIKITQEQIVCLGCWKNEKNQNETIKEILVGYKLGKYTIDEAIRKLTFSIS